MNLSQQSDFFLEICVSKLQLPTRANEIATQFLGNRVTVQITNNNNKCTEICLGKHASKYSTECTDFFLGNRASLLLYGLSSHCTDCPSFCCTDCYDCTALGTVHSN